MDRRLRISLDLLVLGLFCYLLAYRPGAGLYRHGILGVILLILFMVHLLVNRRFFTSLCKGRYTARRILTVTLDVLLLLSGGLMLISSVLLSGDVFDFSPFSQTQLARELHVSAAAWMLLLLFLHAGLHTANFLQRIFYRLSRLGRVVAGVIFGTILLRGLYCFFVSSWFDKLFFEMVRPGPAGQAYIFYGEILLMGAALVELMFLRWWGLKRRGR